MFVQWPGADTPQLIVWETWEKMISSGAVELNDPEVEVDPELLEPDEQEFDMQQAQDMINRVLSGEDPGKVVEQEVDMMDDDFEDEEDEELESFVRSAAPRIEQGKSSFAKDPEKWKKWIKSAGLPKDGFFRACVKKADGFSDDPQKFCGGLKAFAVDQNLANPG